MLICCIVRYLPIRHYTYFMQEDTLKNLWYVAYKNDLENKLEVIHLPTVYERDDGHVHNYRYGKSHFNLNISDRGTITVKL